uniref:aldehyde oxygenase (deformylating) n=3 Tax=Setaria TaxID=4554 RepID=K3YSZ4_SETIT
MAAFAVLKALLASCCPGNNPDGMQHRPDGFVGKRPNPLLPVATNAHPPARPPLTFVLTDGDRRARHRYIHISPPLAPAAATNLPQETQLRLLLPPSLLPVGEIRVGPAPPVINPSRPSRPQFRLQKSAAGGRGGSGRGALLLPGAMGIGAVSDELLGTFVPIAVYWLYSGLYVALDGVGRLDGYRLHTREEAATKNVVSKATVVRGVLVQQAFQVAVSLTLFAVIGDESGTGQKQPPALVIVLQFITAMVVMDTWQYFMHRYMHINKFLYKHIHSKHHTLVVPYSFGALYNHPLEGLILDTIGGALSFLVSGMTPRTSIFFFSFATIKTVDDHCGLWLPGNILQALFSNNSAYHDIHHQLYGNKYNFSQPFFVMWDKILGTYMPYSIEQRKGGGVESRPAKLD